MNKPLLSACLGLTALPLIFIATIYPEKASLEKDLAIPSESTLIYKTEWNVRQSQNACGPYSAAAVIRQLTNNNVSSETISGDTSWRYRGYTLPSGLVDVIRDYGLSADEFIVVGSNKDKIAWLHSHIAEQKPVIILGRKNGLLHYVTLFGYQEGQFSVYDSLEEKGSDETTIDKNAVLPGNSNWTNDELLAFWGEGGVWGLYEYHAIVAETK